MEKKKVAHEEGGAALGDGVEGAHAREVAHVQRAQVRVQRLLNLRGR